MKKKFSGSDRFRSLSYSDFLVPVGGQLSNRVLMDLILFLTG
jgi:hypothetical protein